MACDHCAQNEHDRSTVGQSIPYAFAQVGSTYSIGLPDERACTPETEADPWIADVGDRFAPVIASNRRCSIARLVIMALTVNRKIADVRAETKILVGDLQSYPLWRE